MNLLQLFDFSLVERRDTLALEFLACDGRLESRTFREIEEASNRLARVLADRGLVAGDRLCVYLANCVETIELFLASVKLGVIFVPINILYREREIAHIVSDAEPKGVIAAEELRCGAPVWLARELVRDAANHGQGRMPVLPLDGDAPAAIVYTSGTTGASKGAVLTHNNFAANSLNLITCWQIACADRLLLPLPLFHVHGLANGLCSWLIGGCRMRLLERFEHQKAAEIMRDFRPTLFFGVPTIYARLLDTPPEAAREIGAGMRLFVSGSAPLAAQILEEFRARFGHTILERYGMSETLMNLSNPYIGERRAGTVGFPLPGVSMRLLDPEGRAVADGETGEIYLRGPNVFSGYWRRQDATREAFVDGWFRTGDLAVRSIDGYCTLVGRRSDLIISGGFNIYPREIEEFLTEQPEIAEAAVVGVTDRLRGEVPVAYVVPRSSFDAAELEGRCRSALASYKVPRAFIQVENLPRNAMGKIQKHLLPRP
jgi:malonyl-CoA/methylmalonyl-CoA synthetase